MTLLTGILDHDPLRTSHFLEGSKLAPYLPWPKHPQVVKSTHA